MADPVAPAILHKHSGVPARYWTSTLEGYEPRTPKQKRALEGVKLWADGPLTDRGLLLIGPPGTGKTHLLAAAATARLRRGENGVRFVNVPLFLDEMRAGMAFKESRANERFTELCNEARVVILDDLGREKVTDWVGDRLYVLVEARYSALRPTLVATNRTLNELDAMGYSALVSRLVGSCDAFIVDGADKRMER